MKSSLLLKIIQSGLLLLLLLCGCSSLPEGETAVTAGFSRDVTEFAEKAGDFIWDRTGLGKKAAELFWEQSGIAEDSDYLEYRKLADSEQLDGDGLFYSPKVEEQLAELESPAGAVHVTFARNDYLKFTYFRDAEMTDPLPAENCRLDPGDAVYASAPVLQNPNSSLYGFSEFQVREYDEKGRMKQVLASVREVPGLVYRIPEDFTGTEISLIPLGYYRNRTVTLSAGYVQADGTRKELENGIWEINGKRYGNMTVELDPMESYRVVYDYGAYKDSWYFAGSSPESYWDRSSDGTITFLAVPSNEEHIDYTVTLHPYGSMRILNGVTFQNAADAIWDSASAIFGNRSVIETKNILSLVQVNGITVINNFSDTEVSVPGLKAGDEILIRVPADLKIIASGVKLPPASVSEASREYRFTVPDTEEMQLLLSVTKRNSAADGVYHSRKAARGTLTLFDSSGISYTDGSELPAEDEKITVEIVPDADYCIYGKNVKDNIYRAEMSYSDFLNKYEEILESHPIRPGIRVTLETADELGECVFWSGNEQLHGQVMLREGQDLQFDYILRQDSGYEIILAPEDRGEPISIWSPLAANRQLDVDEEMSGKTLRCRDLLTLKEGVHTDVPVEDFY